MKKIFSSVLALVLAAAVVITVGIGSSWFTNWNVKNWFNSWGKGTEATQPDNSDVNENENTSSSGAIIGSVENNGIQLLSAQIPVEAYSANGVSEKVETAYVLTATITPAAAENKNVEWSVAWVNSDSEWASGKAVTDYVTVTPTADGSLIATVSVLQPFGEQVKITVVSRENSEATANCVCDYVKRLSLNFVIDDNDSLYLNRSKSIENAVSTLCYYEYEYGIGTVGGTVELLGTKFSLTSDILNKIGEHYKTDGHNVGCFTYSLGSLGYVSAEISNVNDGACNVMFYALDNKNLDDIFGLTDENGHEINNVIRNYISSLETVDVLAELVFKQSYKIGDKVLFEREITCPLLWSDIAEYNRMSYSNFIGWAFPVDGVNISDTNIAF